MKILVLGSTGMAGHMITLYLIEKGYDVTAFTRTPFPFCKNVLGNAMDIVAIQNLIHQEFFDYIINCLGILNQHADERKDEAIFINSFLPHYLEKVTKSTTTKIIHLSTDCVFSGERGYYVEQDIPDGKSIYDRTKALGELQNTKDLTFRNSIIGPDMKQNGIGLFNWFMKQNGKIVGYKNVLWNGVTTLELAKGIEAVIMTPITGLYHFVPNKEITKLDLLQTIKTEFQKEISIEATFSPIINKALKNTRTDFPYQVNNYQTMIHELKLWVEKHPKIYTYEVKV